MSRTLKDYLEDMWNAAEEALEFVEGMGSKNSSTTGRPPMR
ncbi:hypothetical protein [Chloracidobacterium aggregatum]|jgi:hypothetical protein|nr:hypothetical protein [Chloracidobacterium aggregatum]